jgi:tetratricopeptide (TPR) repeat protein
LAYGNRGVAYLGLGELDRAIADYDAALKLSPKLGYALLGRGMAKLRKGDAAGGNADIAAAKAADADIAAELARRGVPASGNAVGPAQVLPAP